MAEGGEDVPFVRALLDTGIDGYKPKFTNLIVFIKNTDGTVIWKDKYQTSESHVHAEIQMLIDKEFKDKVEKGKADKTEKVDIILTSNYSPCWECALELKKFYKGKKHLIRKFTIRFSRLYKREEYDNEICLRDLKSKGITLEAMTEESWFDVLMIQKPRFDSMKNAKYSFEEMMNEDDWFDKVMEHFYLDPVKVKKRDVDTRKKLEKLLRQVSSESSDSEAERLANDLKNLKVEGGSD